MQEENLKYLTDQLTKKGFGDEKLLTSLKSQMEEGKAEFQLNHKEEYARTDKQKNEIDFTLHFKKSEDKDRYYFNKFDAELTKAEGEKVKQTFYNAQDKSFAKKEAYNLLDGRFVMKIVKHEDNKFPAHFRLDFDKPKANGDYEMKSYYGKQAFDTGAALNKLPLKEMDAEKKEKLIGSLNRGNIEQVVLANNQKLYASASPMYKNIQLTDAAGKAVKVDMNKESNEISVTYFSSKNKAAETENAKQEISQQVEKTEEVKTSRGMKM